MTERYEKMNVFEQLQAGGDEVKHLQQFGERRL